MARIYAKGYYNKHSAELEYIIKDKYGNILYRLKKGNKIVFSNIVYDVYSKNEKLYVRRNSKKLPSGYFEQELVDNFEMALSTNMQAAYMCLYKKYRHVKADDELAKFLLSIGFVLQCMKIFPSLDGLELKVKSGYNKNCSMYTEDKNWYTYEFFTDSQVIDKLKIVSSSCVGCRAKLTKLGVTCDAENSSLHFKLKGGCYYFLIATDVKTGIKKINELIITKSADRDFILKKLKEAMKK